MPNNITYLKSETAKFEVFAAGGLDEIELLWGDRVRIIGKGRNSHEKKVHARGRTGYINTKHLGGEPLLEVYFIDVGQGDGVLIVTPDRKNILIDGGYPRRNQPTGKNAADFIDWKFHKDYEMSSIELDAVMCSHNDQDHYGGLWDLFNPDEESELNVSTKDVYVERFYHAGLSHLTLDGKKSLGQVVDSSVGNLFVDLIDSRGSVLQKLKSSANPKLQGEWAKFLRCATKMKRKDGSAMPMQRLGASDEYVPGFAPENNDLSMKVLAPVDFDVGGKTGIRHFGSTTGLNTNGNSLLLRLDFGRSRILLTGDLNTKSMQYLLEDWSGMRQEFECDVAKACHHGSDDISYEFLAAMRPAVTVISSGDAEGHDHPRPSVVAASATTGHFELKYDKLVSPLIYSTELARSLKIGETAGLEVDLQSGPNLVVDKEDLDSAKATLEVTVSGGRNPRKKTRSMANSYMVSGVIYGLVNVRTDGDKILCATMSEKDASWQVKTIRSRF